MPTKGTTTKKPGTADKATAAKSNVIPLRQRAEEEIKDVTSLARKHPVLTVAGGLAIGLVIGALTRRGAAGKLLRGGLAIAEVAGTAAAVLGREARDKAGSAGAAGRDLSSRALHRAETAGVFIRKRSEDAATRAGELLAPAEDAASSAAEAGQRLLRKAVEFAVRARH